MAKLNFVQRRELASILAMAAIDEELLADSVSDLIVARDKLGEQLHGRFNDFKGRTKQADKTGNDPRGT